MKFLVISGFVLASVALLLSACGDDDETTTSETATPSTTFTGPPTITITQSSTPMQSGGGGGGEVGPGTVVAPPPVPSPSTAPSDRKTFEFGPAGRFSYPGKWLAIPQGGIFSWDTLNDNSPAFAHDGIKIEYSGLPPEQDTPPPEATRMTFASDVGWQLVTTFDPSKADGLARVHTFWVDHSGTRYHLIGYFGPDADLSTFQQILATLRFGDG